MSTNLTKKHSDLRKIGFFLLVAAAIVALVLLFTGCSTQVSPKPDPKASAATTDETPAVASDPEPTDDGVKTFGSTSTWDDGVTVSVSKPAPYSPTDVASGAVKGQKAVVFTIVITNNSDSTYDPTFINTAVSSGGEEASQIFDVTADMGFPPQTKVLKGKTIKWQEAYSVADAADIQYQISAGIEYADAIFTNAK